MPTTTTTKDSNKVKIAVESPNKEHVPQLIEFDQKRSLKLIIQDLCSAWEISDHEQYALQFNDREVKNYITEKNRNEIKNGSILRVTFSPSRAAADILQKLQFGESSDERLPALRSLVKLSMDYVFALEFINKQGLQFLIDSIENGIIGIKDGAGFGFALESFVELMEHGIISWDHLEPKFICKIATQVNAVGGNTESDAKILINSLAILESIVVLGVKFNSLVESEVTLPNLISSVRLYASNPEIQQNAIALINALFSKSDPSKRKATANTLSDKRFRNVILDQVLNPRTNSGNFAGATVGAEMAHQLYVLQSLLLNLHEERMNAVPNQANESELKDLKEKVAELRKFAFDDNVLIDGSNTSKGVLSGTLNRSTSLSGHQEDYKRLGFNNSRNPVEDFNESPPGLLALDLMIYFARHHTETYAKTVLENCCRSDREHECPFVKSSIQLTKLISEILKVGETPSDEGKLYYPMLFTHDHPLQEFYCIAVSLLNKTWKEMRATVEDFVKVFSVLKQQLTRALVDQEAVSSFDKFKIKLSTLPYSEIMSLWQKERISREEWENKAQAILELREMVKPEIIALIKQQRLRFLTEGTQFGKYSNKGQRVKDKFWFCRLSSNQKAFCWGDCDEKQTPLADDLPQKLLVSDIKSLVIGRDCPHMKDTSKKQNKTFVLAFSLIPQSEQEEPLCFVAPDPKTFDYWTDGINALLDQDMMSQYTKNDLDTLLTMDIKLRLLDTEGVTIPEVPPEIPPPPPNYDFNFKY